MPENDFIPFAAGSGANVETQAAYAADSQTALGVSSGTARSNIANKAWRQGSIIASVVAQFINNITGQATIDDGTTATLVTNLTNAVRYGSPVLHVVPFTISGSWTAPANVTQARFRVWGGGGGGCGSNNTGGGTAGGGGGGYAEGIYTVVPGTAYAVTVGGGGAAGTAGSFAPGGNGGTSSVASFLSATGGTSGGAGPEGITDGAPAPGGVGSGGNIVNATGGSNMAQFVTASSVTTYQPGGYGGAAAMGGPGGGGQRTNPYNGGFPGGGGSGAGGSTTGTFLSGAGAAGLVIVEYFV